MSVFYAPLNDGSPRILSVLRTITGFLVLRHGSPKFSAFPPKKRASAFTTFAGILEFGGILILIGLFTRPATFILNGMMAVAYFTLHVVLNGRNKN